MRSELRYKLGLRYADTAAFDTRPGVIKRGLGVDVVASVSDHSASTTTSRVAGCEDLSTSQLIGLIIFIVMYPRLDGKTTYLVISHLRIQGLMTIDIFGVCLEVREWCPIASSGIVFIRAMNRRRCYIMV